MTFGVIVLWHFRTNATASVLVDIQAADLFHYFLPAYTFEAARLRQLELPFWNPYQAAGQPFIAVVQPGALYPARLLLLLMSAPAAMEWSTLGHVLLALVGTYALCRALGASCAGAAAGAAVFTGTFSLPNIYNPAYLEPGAWLPVAAFALVPLTSDARWRWPVLLGLAMGLSVLAGGFPFIVYAAYGWLLLAVALLADSRWRGRFLSRGVMGRLCVAGLLAFGTAAPQLLPSLLWMAETVRGTGGLTDAQIQPSAMPWKTLAGYFARQGHPWIGWRPGYLPYPVAILALIGFLTGKRFGAVLGITTLVVLLLSLGRGTPWWVVYKAIPLLSILRSPSRLFSLVAFFAALGAALGVTALSRQAVARGSLYGKLAQLALLAIVLGALFKRASNRAHVPWTVSPEDLAGPRELWGTVERVTAGGRTALPVDSIDFTVGLRQGMMKRIPVVQDYEPISSRRAAAYLRAVAGLPPPSPTEAFPFDGAVTLTKRIVRPQLLDLLAVRSVVLPLSVPPPERVPPFEAVTRDAFHVVYANPLALARAYTVAHARFVDTEQEALAAVLEQGFDGRRDAVVLNRPEGDEAMLLSQDPTPLHEARIITDLPERVEVEFDVSQPSLLVLADSFAPGWSVRVDAAARSVRQVNAYVRGVFIRPGEHRAEFRYHAPGFAAGLGIAVAAWGVALLLIARSRVG